MDQKTEVSLLFYQSSANEPCVITGRTCFNLIAKLPVILKWQLCT